MSLEMGPHSNCVGYLIGLTSSRGLQWFIVTGIIVVTGIVVTAGIVVVIKDRLLVKEIGGVIAWHRPTEVF